MVPEPRVGEGTGSRPRGTGRSLGLEEILPPTGWRKEVNKEVYRHERVTWMVSVVPSVFVLYGQEAACVVGVR